jgi:hypothetical protein
MVEMSIRILHTDPLRNHQRPLMCTVIIQPLTSDFRDLKKPSGVTYFRSLSANIVFLKFKYIRIKNMNKINI